MGVDLIRNPANALQTPRLDGLGREQCVIDTAETQSDNQHHRQSQVAGEIGSIEPVRQWHAKAADALDDDDIDHRGELSKTINNAVRINSSVRLFCGDVRCNRRREKIRIDQRPIGGDARCGNQRFNVFVALLTIYVGGTRRNRLHANRGQSMIAASLDQARADQGLADFSVGASDETAA